MKKIFLFLVTVLALTSCTPKLTESVKASFPNGQPQVVRKYDKSGICVYETEYYETGQVMMEGPMKGENREGEWKAYFPDGRTQSIGTFENGLRTGQATVWQQNGNLLQEGFYKEGKHCGKWKFYDEQGDLVKEVDFGSNE